MDQLENQKNQVGLIECRSDNDNNNDRVTEYHDADNRGEDPLSKHQNRNKGEPEVTVNLNSGSTQLPLHPLEDPEEDMLDYETDISSQETTTESEEQVVPSSQLSNSYKYPEELTISDDEIDEGIFEDDPASYDLVLADDNSRYDSQPP